MDLNSRAQEIVLELFLASPWKEALEIALVSVLSRGHFDLSFLEQQTEYTHVILPPLVT